MNDLSVASPSSIANILISGGYQGKIEKIEDYYLVQTAAEGWSINIRFMAETHSSSDEIATSIQFWSFWKINREHAAKLIDISNHMNSTYRFVKTFINQSTHSHHAEIIYDHYCVDGLTENTFKNMMAHFIEVRRYFFESYIKKCSEEEKILKDHPNNEETRIFQQFH